MVDYKFLAKQARLKVLSMVHLAKTSHIASNFSILDVATVLYENLKEGDEVVWSAGWKAASIYYFLHKQGKLTDEQLAQFPNAPYFGLAETTVPGVHVSGGSMGHGLPVAVGMALGKKRAGEPGTIYCIMSDGEHQEGTTWESAQIASHNKLGNLVIIVDYNKWCAMGETNDVCNLEPFQERWGGFGFKALRIDGHSFEEIEEAIKANPDSNKPTVIICDTIKGKGVKEFEDKILYHYKNVDDETFEMARKELCS